MVYNMIEIEKSREIIDLVRKGYSLVEISDIICIPYQKLLKIKEEVMQNGEAGEQDFEEGKKARKRRRLEESKVVKKILKYKRMGQSDTEISTKPDISLTQAVVSKYVRECIALGMITTDEIERAKEAKKQDEKNNNNDRKIIIESLRRGETRTTVIAKNTTIGYQQVGNIIEKLIKEGVITQEEIDLARENANTNSEKEETNVDSLEIDKEKLLSYLIIGYDTQEIRGKMNISDINTYKIAVQGLIRENRVTKDAIKEYRQKKKEKDKAKVLERFKKWYISKKYSKSIRYNFK